jgi:hypothetical protein
MRKQCADYSNSARCRGQAHYLKDIQFTSGKQPWQQVNDYGSGRHAEHCQRDNEKCKVIYNGDAENSGKRNLK